MTGDKTGTDFFVLGSIVKHPKASMPVELVLALSGMKKDAVMESLERLVQQGFITKHTVYRSTETGTNEWLEESIRG